MKLGERRGNAGPWKTRKTKTRFPFVSHRPWKSLRDSHIPTRAGYGPFSSENQQEKTTERNLASRLPDFIPSGSFLD
jgi:hypothetical protein